MFVSGYSLEGIDLHRYLIEEVDWLAGVAQQPGNQIRVFADDPEFATKTQAIGLCSGS